MVLLSPIIDHFPSLQLIRKRRSLVLCGLLALALMCSAARPARGESLEFGFAKRDITPRQPLRLSGYGSRDRVADGVDEKLHVRAMAVRSADRRIRALVSVETIGVTGEFTKAVFERVREKHEIDRAGFVVCCTHSHTAPHLAGGLSNLFATPLTEEQAQNTRKYTDQLADQIVAAVDGAIADLQPGKLYAAEGKVGFANNRRLLKDGKWVGFGVRPDGVTDHALPILRIVGADGATRGVVFNYACHCTTFGGGYNRVSGDWAGYASKFIEQSFAGAVALCAIGCGGDQNPVRDDDGEKAKALAISHGRQIADEVARLAQADVKEITAPLRAAFGYAGLPVDRPSLAELRKALQDRRLQVRRHAEAMIQLQRRMGRLPETYPAPVQVWRFGDQMCLVFLGGEVVVDYALRLKRELSSDLVWVSAYANDVFGYVASQRMREEGGYEVSDSMIYYNQPGPWADGAEEVLIRRVHELVEQGSFAGPFSPEDALGTFRLAEGFAIGLVAAEPLIADPVHFAVGADGCLWVAEMGDYPLGEDGRGKPNGRIRLLRDTDGDGRYDKSSLFLQDLSYPNSVFPWRKGVLLCSAPHIYYAEDTDGDDRADVKKPLYSGLAEANPQHRAAGFAWGLDNWIYLSGGANNGQVKSEVTGESTDVSSRDFRIDPRSGAIEPVGGHTQFGRNRDDWGNWFGGSNSNPIVHYVMSDAYLGRNPFFPAPDPTVHLLTPATAPPVFPASRTLDRFNDLFALNRFTSACSPIVFRDDALGKEVAGAGFVAEPVHNLVHRLRIIPQGATFRGSRLPEEQDREFLASSDHWFRPTTIATGPDGSLWVADMYRQVIEHPEWIPESWQAKLDLRAGHQQGRIYRVYRVSHPPGPIPDLSEKSSRQLVAELESSNGWRRDTAQRLLVDRADEAVVGALEKLLRGASRPVAKAHALGVLQGLQRLTPASLRLVLNDADPRVLRLAIRFSEPWLNRDPSLGPALPRLLEHADIRVQLQLALSLGEWDDPRAAHALAQIAAAHGGDPWVRAGVLSSSRKHANRMLPELLSGAASQQGRADLVQHLISTALGADQDSGLAGILAGIVAYREQPANWQFDALRSFDQALRRRQTTLAQLRRELGKDHAAMRQMGELFAAAARIAEDDRVDQQRRAAATRLLGHVPEPSDEDLNRLGNLLSPQQSLEIQRAGVRALADMDTAPAGKRLLRSWKQLSPALQAQVSSVLIARDEWRELLLAAMEAKRVSPGDLDAATRERLASGGDSAWQRRARKALGDAPNSNRQLVIERYAGIADLAGDPRRGAELFKKTCSACHRHHGLGNEFAPSLAALKNKSDENLLLAVLDPNRAVEGKYKNYVCATQDGRVLSGMIVEETSGSITLAQASGVKITLLRVDIESLSTTGLSLMPEGLEKDLAPQALADVFAFVRSPDGDKVTR